MGRWRVHVDEAFRVTFDEGCGSWNNRDDSGDITGRGSLIIPDRTSLSTERLVTSAHILDMPLVLLTYKDVDNRPDHLP